MKSRKLIKPKLWSTKIFESISIDGEIVFSGGWPRTKNSGENTSSAQRHRASSTRYAVFIVRNEHIDSIIISNINISNSVNWKINSKQKTLKSVWYFICIKIIHQTVDDETKSIEYKMNEFHLSVSKKLCYFWFRRSLFAFLTSSEWILAVL